MFFKFPYTDLYTLNLDWMIKFLKEAQISLEQWQEIIDGLGTIVHSVNGQTGDVNLGTLVNSVNGQTGNVNLGTLVNSVNGKTGEVEIDNDDINALKIELVLQTTDPANTFTPAVVTPLFNSGIRFIIINNKEFYSITEAGAMIRFNPFEDLNISKELAQPPANQAEIEALYNQGIRFIRYTVSDVVRHYALEKINSVVVAYDLDGTNGANLFNFIDSNETIADYSTATLQSMYNSGVRILFQDETNGIRKFYALLGTEVDGYTGYTEYDPVNYFDTQFVPSLQNDINALKSALSENEIKTEFAINTFEDTGLWQQTAAELTPTNSVVNSSGAENAGDSFRHLEKSVNQGEIYFVSGHKFSSSFPCYLFLNSSTVVSYETDEANGKFTDLMIVIPSGINKLIVNGSSTNIPIIATRSGIKAGTHSEIMDIRSVLAKQYSDLTITTSAGVYSKANSYNSADSFKHTIISVTEGDTIKFSTYRVSDYYPAYVFRNSNGVVDYEDDLSNGAVYNIEVNVPSGATDMVINSNASTDISVAKKVAVEAAAKSDLNSKADKPNDWEEQTGTLVNGKLYGSSSSQPKTETWSYRTITNNNGFENGKIKVTGSQFSSYFALVAYLDGNGTTISKSELTDSTAYEDYILTNIPSNCRTIVVNNAELINGTGTKPHIYTAGDVITVDQCAINYAKREAAKATLYENLPTGYEGKKIAFFGTSIMSAAVYNIPRYAAEVLGFDIINEALGSSCARRGWKSQETVNDPYGWTGVSWQNVFLAMGASLEEKQDLIDNYTTKWADLLGGDYEGSSGDGTGTGKPQTLDAEWIEKIKNASYEKKLIPYLDGTKPMPDLFIFEHGYNDYDSNDPLTGDVEDESNLDMSVYSDAMYFYIQKIFEANPQAKIMICSHYENQTTRGDTVWSAQKELALYHGLWFCDVANGIGWTQRKVKTTGYWDTTTHLWVPSGGLLQTMTRKQQCLYDDLHPHNDWSGNASRREGEIIAQFIRSHIVL